MIVRVVRGSPREFILTFDQALGDLTAVAMAGSGEKQVGDRRLRRFREFFGPAPTAEEGERRIQAWRRMSRDERVLHAVTASWGLANVLHMLEPSMREWTTWRLQVTSPDTVAVEMEGDGMDASRGVIRQVVRFAGGELLDDPKPGQGPSWAFWRRRGATGRARQCALPATQTWMVAIDLPRGET